MTKKKKVFCGECAYYGEFNFPPACNYPENKVDDWYAINHDYVFEPRSKNEKNQCEWFKHE